MNKSNEITVHNKGEVSKYKIIVTAPISTELLKKYIDETLGEIGVPSLDGYATEDFVIQKINSINLSGYALKIDLNNYVKKEELEDKADISYVDNKVSSIDLSKYALTSDLSSAIESINSDIDLKADKTELNELASKTWVEEQLSGYTPIAE